MKVALVTGATRGLGKSLADLLVDRNYYVYYGVRQPGDKQQADNWQAIQLDVTDDDSIMSAAKKIKENSGGLDLLINNAGLSRSSATKNHPEKVMKLSELEREALGRIFEVNAISPVMVSKYMVPLMTNNNCFIVNISSIRSLYENSKEGVGSYGYSSSKIALNMMTLMLAHDLPRNIATFAVHPGSVQTDMNPAGQLSPNESANYILAIIQGWKSRNNGKALNYDGMLLI